jgi:hypothetical protein
MYNQPPDFEAEVRFLSHEEGGRTGSYGPVRQGYRCDIHWDDDPSDLLYMIWPSFLDESGQELPIGAVISQVSNAHFHIASPKAKPIVYRQWLREDARFHLSEGLHRVAACRVTKVLSSYEDAA